MQPFRIGHPLVRQYDQLDCGPAALLSVLRWHGGSASLVHTRRLCHTDQHGSTLLDLAQAAEAMGFKATGVRGTFADLANAPMPCIVHVVLQNGFSHFLVIYKIWWDQNRIRLMQR